MVRVLYVFLYNYGFLFVCFCMVNHEVKEGLVLILVAFTRSFWEDHILVDNALE